ncbi:MAG: ATP-dependent endonuclease [Fimbriimonadaceae bacterium]|jgi:predicted ATPase|nr:ATP-dependent endonuclease [Fimbriimonadaceae bacterium]
MKIKSVKIQNFRTLKDVQIDFDAVTTFIGPNGTGKSTVLRALDWFFNGGKQGELSERDCSFGSTDEKIEVQVTFGDLTDKDREALGKYAPEGAVLFTAWKTRQPDGSETFSANAKGYPAFNKIRELSKAGDQKSAYTELRSAEPSLNLPAWTNQSDSLQVLTSWEANNIHQLVEAPETQTTKFFGFNSGGKMSDLFDFVLVTADLRAGEEAQDTKSSVIGKLLERSVDRSAADEEIAKIVESSRVAQQKVYEEKFAHQLTEIKKQLNDVVATYSPGRTIHVVPSEVELRAPKTSFDVSVFDGETETIVERQGHGFQRTLLVSALQVLAESTSSTTEGVICLAIEEPELFQHPIQAQAFAKVLRALAEDSSKRIQVTYATHSPYFLEAKHFDQVRRLTRSQEATPIVTVHCATIADVKARLSGVVREEVVERQLDGIVTGQLSVALFASRAFLVEGTTESSVFYGIGDRVGAGSLEAAGISIVPVGGKQSIPLAHAILSALGIPVYALFDGDKGFQARAEERGRPAEKIDEERKGHISANRSLLKYFGLDEVDFPASIVEEHVAIFDDHLEAFLDANWPEWSTACKAVESEAGVSLAKNQLAYRTATIEAGGVVPSALEEILTKVTGT